MKRNHNCGELQLKSENARPDTLQAVADFSVRLLQNSYHRANTLLSPVSLLAVLAMAQLGAGGNTKKELDGAIGTEAANIMQLVNRMFMPEQERPEYSPWARLVGNEQPATINFANALWLNNNGRVHFRPEYLEVCKDMSNGDIHQIPFDSAACESINKWAEEKTNGQIAHVVDSLPEDAAMFLANALLFDGKWMEAYQPSDVKKRIFTSSDGRTQLVEFMEGEESQYLRDNQAQGFIKHYQGARYAFAALLPNEEVSLQSYISGLDGERLLAILENPRKHKVKTRMPKFAMEQKLDLKRPLLRIGIQDAFNQKTADFSKMGVPTDPTDNLCIGDVWQINKINVNEDGTQAISFTGMDVMCLKSCVEPEPYHVYLDRPFLYMIFDKETNLPLFMGTVNNL